MKNLLSEKNIKLIFYEIVIGEIFFVKIIFDENYIYIANKIINDENLVFITNNFFCKIF